MNAKPSLIVFLFATALIACGKNAERGQDRKPLPAHATADQAGKTLSTDGANHDLAQKSKSGQGDTSTLEESEVVGDLEKLNTAERKMEAVGWRFKTDVDHTPDSVSTTYSWDTEYLKAHFANHPSTQKADMIAAMQGYLDVARAFHQKYSGEFHLLKNDGTIETRKILESAQKGIGAKLSLTERMISSLTQPESA